MVQVNNDLNTSFLLCMSCLCVHTRNASVCMCVYTHAHMCSLIVYVCELYMACPHTVIHTCVLRLYMCSLYKVICLCTKLYPPVITVLVPILEA